MDQALLMLRSAAPTQMFLQYVWPHAKAILALLVCGFAAAAVLGLL
jgi:hypothetical protein